MSTVICLESLGGWVVGVESEFSDRLWLELSLGQAEQCSLFPSLLVIRLFGFHKGHWKKKIKKGGIKFFISCHHRFEIMISPDIARITI